jgi:UDP-3-O-[3-hydroxymyristoyl] glucosamine N-acyltransferase
MPDPRFYEDLGPIPSGELAVLAGAEPPKSFADRLIFGVAPLNRADERSVGFLADRRYLTELDATAAGACFVTAEHAERLPQGCVGLVTSEPQAAFARAAAALHRIRRHAAEDPQIHPDARFEEGVSLHHGAVIGPGASIGRGTSIGANSVIGPGVAIGRDCAIGANVVIGFALIGDHVRILSGAVIGEAGFGVAVGRTGILDAPQLGRAIIQDRVTIGACTCIDRGAFEDTIVGENSKIDNLVQIAHNVHVGRNCVLAGHVGLSGSVTVGDGAMFGGRAGIADHISIGAGAQIAAAAGVMHDVPAGERWAGIPAKPVRKFMRESAWLAKMAGAREGNVER